MADILKTADEHTAAWTEERQYIQGYRAERMIDTLLADYRVALERLNVLEQRYHHIVTNYVRCRDRQWHLNSPYLGGIGKEFETFDEAIDADIRHRAS